MNMNKMLKISMRRNVSAFRPFRSIEHCKYYSGTTTNSSKSKSKNGGQWFAIPVSVGIIYIGLMQLYKISKRPDVESELYAELKTLPFYLRVYASLPLRYISQCWGYINDLTLPLWARSPVYKTYSYLLGCNLDEMVAPPLGLEGFENLGQFFYRSLKDGVRPLANTKLVSPCDGKILYCGEVGKDGNIEQIKGGSYTISNLMGPPLPSKQSWLSYLSLASPPRPGKEYKPSTSSNSLYYAVIYLAPGDYHRFHAPSDCTISQIRHFYGEMFSVSPFLVSRFPRLFTLNERVACLGTWKYGVFGMTAVAATNVGKIVINALPDLETNARKDTGLVVPHGTPKSVVVAPAGISITKGQEMGGFKLGSTIVLVFEAPKTYKFCVGEGDGVRMGQSIGNF